MVWKNFFSFGDWFGHDMGKIYVRRNFIVTWRDFGPGT